MFTYLSTIVLISIWRENLVNCGKYELEFWERDPKFERRFFTQVTKHRVLESNYATNVPKDILLRRNEDKYRSRIKYDKYKQATKQSVLEKAEPTVQTNLDFKQEPTIRHFEDKKTSNVQNDLEQQLASIIQNYLDHKLEPTTQINGSPSEKYNRIDRAQSKSKQYSHISTIPSHRDVQETPIIPKPRSIQNTKPKQHQSESLRITRMIPVHNINDNENKITRMIPVHNINDNENKITRMIPVHNINDNENKAESRNIVRHKSSKIKKEPEELTALSPSLTPYNLVRHLKKLTCNFPDAKISHEVLGKTLSYNDIILLKIKEKRHHSVRFRADDDAMKYADEPPEKKIVFIVHALSTMGFNALPCLSEAEDFTELLGYYLKYLNIFDIFLVPMANPDGVSENHAYNLWNKNFSPQSACPGVALDRNFDVAWNETKTNMSSCSQQYPGPYPFSETESGAIREIFRRYSNKLYAYFHVHGGSYTSDFFKGDAVLYPKGYTDMQSEDDKYIDLKGDIDEEMRKAGFQAISVTVDSLHSWYGKVSGTSVDFASSIFGIPYTLELVMQVYNSDSFQKLALQEIWKRVIDVIFSHLGAKSQNKEIL